MPKNHNHPARGSTIKVEPIRDLEDILRIKRLLVDRPRDLALFTIGINTNLRASDLVRLTVGQLRNRVPMDEIEIREQKTGKIRRITLNRACCDAIRQYLQSLGAPTINDDRQFFASRKSGGGLTASSICRMVKSWCRAINLRGNYGSHTLRKTWGYHQRVTYAQPLPVLCECFGHATQKQTLTYLCIQPEEIKNVYANEL